MADGFAGHDKLNSSVLLPAGEVIVNSFDSGKGLSARDTATCTKVEMCGNRNIFLTPDRKRRRLGDLQQKDVRQ